MITKKKVFGSLLGLVLVGLIVGLVIKCSHLKPASKSLDYYKSNPVRVVKVLDGDSVILESNQEARLLAIDAPEKEEPFARQARDFLRQLIEGKKVILEFDEEILDDYQRLLVYAYLDPGKTQMANALLLEKGLACTYFHLSDLKYKYKEYFIQLQNQARASKKGLWSIEIESKESYYVASQKSGVFHRPGCKWAKHIKSMNLMRFQTRDEALVKGLRPCKNCKP